MASVGVERTKVCIICHLKANKLKVCGKCQSRSYCSVDCQRKDWLAGHKDFCQSREVNYPFDKALSMLTKLNEFNYILMILVHEMKKLMGEKILAPILFLLGQPDDPKFEMYLVFNFIPLDDFKRVVTRNLQDLGRNRSPK